jgi:hypothetical protein
MLFHRRLSAAAIAVLAAFGVILPAVAASAAGAAGAAGGADAGYEIARGWFILGATVTCTHSPARQLNSKQAAAFIESWYFASIYGTLTEQQPPPSLSECTFLARDRINGNPFQFRAFYVAQGKKAWIGLPRQVIGPGAFVPVDKWYVATPRATPAFLGRLDPLPSPAPTTTTTTTTPVAAAADKGSGSSVGWIAGGITLAVLLAGAIAVVVRSRRRATASEPAASEPA